MPTTSVSKSKASAPKFSDTAILVLSNAALRPSRLVLPLPRSVKVAPAVVEKTILQLKAKNFIEELPATPKDEVWRKDENERPLTLAITQSGVEAVDGGFLAESILPLKRAKKKVNDVDQAKNARSTQKASRQPKLKAGTKRDVIVVTTLKTRNNTKATKILALLRRYNGVTIAEMVKATGWQAHSIRGFLSGTVKKRMHLKLTTAQAEGKDRRYKVPAKA